VILADTSAWVEYDRATNSTVDRRVAELIDEAGPLATTEPVVMEVLAGARHERREAQLRRLLERFELLASIPSPTSMRRRGCAAGAERPASPHAG
jgi:predicted nucleic acid-binding protein